MVEILLMMKRSTWRWETIKIRPFQPKQKGSDLTLLIPELESENQTETTPTSSSSSRLDSDSTSEASYLPCHCCQNSKDKKAEISSKLISNSASSSLNWKLMLLLTIASAALASILIISHQVGTRKHLHQYQSLPKLKKLWKSEANTDLFNFPSSPYSISHHLGNVDLLPADHPPPLNIGARSQIKSDHSRDWVEVQPRSAKPGSFLWSQWTP